MPKKFPWLLFIFVAVSLLVYLYFSLSVPVSSVSQKLGLGSTLVRYSLSISFALPLFASVFFGLWASMLLFQKEFRPFAVGVLIITSILILNLILGQIRSRFSQVGGEEVYKWLTIIINYIYSFGYIAGFYAILDGTRKLLSHPIRKWNIAVSILVVLLIGILYSGMLFTNADRLVASIPEIKPSHFLPDWLLLWTIVLPTVFSWFLAILAAFSLADVYSIPAVPKRQEGLRKLLYGVLFIIFSGIILQVILSIGTARFLTSGTSFILIVIYVFVFILAAGNLFVLKGAKKLVET